MRRGVVLIILAACLPLPLPAQHSGSTELQLKAAVASKLPAFTEWPATATSKRASLELCVPRSAEVTDHLTALVAGERVHGMPVTVREISGASDIGSCHLLFVPETSNAPTAALLRSARAHPVLTVGDSSDFLDEGGMVALRLTDGRIRFEINLDATQKSGLRLSSQLLKLAMHVRGAAQ